MRLVAAMSGGVDSAVATARMVRAGHDVVGVHLALARVEAGPGSRGCCSIRDAQDARRVADHLDIPFYVWDLSREFERAVVADFTSEYAAGRTPNPCLRCNERIKFAALLERARALGFDGVVTGHYARVVPAQDSPSGHRELHRAVDHDKDQSYVLGVLTSEQLAGAFFPLGESVKPAVRREAELLGLAVAAKPDSNDICFVPAAGGTRAWLAHRLGARPGDIVATDGTVVGRHEGALGYTVGQRRGLALGHPSADGEPRYVLSIDPARNVVVVGPERLLTIDEVVGRNVRWCGPPPDGDVAVGVQLRAHGREVPAVARLESAASAEAALQEHGEHVVASPRLVVRLLRPTRGVAPGQTVVMYDGTRVVGSATITATALRAA